MNLKNSVREPIPELFAAAKYLDAAVSAHFVGNSKLATRLLIEADMEALRDWTESHWGSNTPHKEITARDTSVPILSKDNKIPVRMPNSEEKKELHKRDGFHCRFCGVPVIRKEVRDHLKKLYPEAVKWGRTNSEQHASRPPMQSDWDGLERILKSIKSELSTPFASAIVLTDLQRKNAAPKPIDYRKLHGSLEI